MQRKLIKVLYIMFCLIIILARECYAYLDPSAMTYVIQIVSAIVITLATSIGIFFYKIKRFLKNKKEKQKSKEEKE